MIYHLTPWLLATAFVVVWGFAAVIKFTDAMREIRRRRTALQGPHYLSGGSANRQDHRRTSNRVRG